MAGPQAVAIGGTSRTAHTVNVIARDAGADLEGMMLAESPERWRMVGALGSSPIGVRARVSDETLAMRAQLPLDGTAIPFFSIRISRRSRAQAR